MNAKNCVYCSKGTENNLFEKITTCKLGDFSYQILEFRNDGINSSKRIELLGEFLLEARTNNKKVLITGLAASGKTFITRKLNKKYDLEIEHLDNYGIHKNEFYDLDGQLLNQWFIEEEKIPLNKYIFEGISDNFDDVIDIIEPDFIIMIRINLKSYRRELKRRKKDKRYNMFHNTISKHYKYSEGEIENLSNLMIEYMKIKMLNKNWTRVQYLH